MAENMGELKRIGARIDALKENKEHVIVAIDGGAGSGKSTLAAALGSALHADVLHMDDFFLQPHQRTPERFAQPGGNVDYERFLSEVLLPLSRGEAYTYRRFDCASLALCKGERRLPAAVTIVEGSYSLHPALEKHYDLRILLTIGSEEQSARILAREGSEKHARFLREWIPMENLYFDKTQIASRCDMVIDAAQLTREETI